MELGPQADEQPIEVPTTDRLVGLEGDVAMLELFHDVPERDLAQRMSGRLEHALLHLHARGRRSHALEALGVGEVELQRLRGREALELLIELPLELVEPRVLGLSGTNQVVGTRMLPEVMRLLLHEAAHLLALRSFGHPLDRSGHGTDQVGLEVRQHEPGADECVRQLGIVVDEHQVEVPAQIE